MRKSILTLSLIAAFISLTHTATAQQQGERLVARSQYDPYSGIYYIEDSITYIYSGGRSIDTIWGTQQAFDSSYYWFYEGSAYYPFTKTVQVWNNNILLSDTVYILDTLTATYSYSNYQNYVYDTSGRVAGYATLRWNSTLSVWDSSGLYSQYYDASGYRTQYLDLGLSSGVWDTFQNFSVIYTSTHQISSTTFLEWFAGTENGSYSTYSYNSLGQNDTAMDYTLYHDSIWLPSYMDIDTYDISGYLSTDYGLFWSDSLVWIVDGRDTLSYDGNHNVTAITEQVPDSALGIWVNSTRRIETYDSYNMITTYTSEEWDTTGTGSWVPNDGKYYFYYELYTLPCRPSVAISASALTVGSGAQDTFTAVPVNGGSPTYQWYYDGVAVGGDSATYIAPILHSGDSVRVVMTGNAVCAYTAPPDTSNTLTLTVINGISAVSGDGTVKIYPIPNTGAFAIDIPGAGGQLSISDIYGQQVYRTPITTSHQQISDMGLPPAVYFATVTSGSHTQTIKMQIVKE